MGDLIFKVEPDNLHCRGSCGDHRYSTRVVLALADDYPSLRPPGWEPCGTMLTPYVPPGLPNTNAFQAGL